MSVEAPLMVTISGIRGIIGKSLFPAIVEKYVGAFACMLQRRLPLPPTKGEKQPRPIMVLGRDSRVSGPCILRLVEGILVASGFDVLNVGIVPTPTVQFAVQHHKSLGGIVVTSSHNPIMWNGLKFVDSDGLFLSPELCKTMFAMADAGERHYVPYDHLGQVIAVPAEGEDHLNAILGLEYVHPEEVQSRKFKVCLDSVNGAGGPIMKLLLEKLGCEVVGLNLEPTGVFAHRPEPIPEHLGDLCKAVRDTKSDLGIAVDPDVDRCVLVDEHGEPLGEEYTLALAVQFMLGTLGKRGPVCKNLSTSRAIDAIAEKYKCSVENTPVGEIQVAKRMVAVSSVIGGEGNGGVMLPDVHIGRDAPVAATLVLQLLSGFKGTISELKATLPQYHIAKHKAELGGGLNPDAAVAHFKAKYASDATVKLNDADGLRIDHADWWVHLRKSNTEPIIRVIGEAGSTKAESDALCQQFMDEIKGL